MQTTDTSASTSSVSSRPGRLDPARSGYSTPVDSPLYPPLPYQYTNARSLVVMYETDEEAAADLLPEGLDLSLPATARLIVFHYPETTIGPYDEAILSLGCLWQGRPLSYIAYILVTSDAALAAGREIAGYPKKLARIELREESGLLRAIVERPAGMRLLTAAMRVQQPLPVPPPALDAATATLRVIPSPEKGARPSVADLVLMQTPMTVREMSAGPATLSFESQSDEDPWHRLPVRKILGGIANRCDFTLDHGEVLRSYL